MLNEQEKARYHRQILLDEIGEEGQKKLKRAKVLVAGVGGLGCATSVYLASAGVGWMQIVDCDRVSLSDLNRQVLYSNKDIGKAKVDLAKARLESLNPEVHIEAVDEKISEGGVFKLAAGCDLIVDGMDNLPARYLLNRAAICCNIPLFHGAVHGFEGKVTTVIPGRTPCLNCLYRDTVPATEIPVIGTTPAVIGCIQANEVVKYIVGAGELLTNRILIYDGLSSRFREVSVARDTDCSECSKLFKRKGSRN